MQVDTVDVLISNGKQQPNTRRARTTPAHAEKWSIQFIPGSIEGILLTVYYPPRVGSRRSPAYKLELGTISKPQ